MPFVATNNVTLDVANELIF